MSQALEPSDLYHPCDPNLFAFETTAELEPLAEIIGQARAEQAIHFGVGMRREGYNLYVMGPAGMGKHSVVHQYLEQRSAAEPTPPDWCYVNNFEQSHKPKALQLPPGRGNRLRRDMEQLVEDLSGAIPAIFESDEYRTRLQGIEDELKERQEASFKRLAEEAQKHQIKLFRTPGGFAFAPLKEGEVLGPEEFEKLPPEEQRRIEEIVANLQESLQNTIKQIPQWRKETREKVKALNRESATSAVEQPFQATKESYRDLPEVVEYLEAVRQDVLRNVDDFLKAEEPGEMGAPQAGPPTALHRYKVNVLVDNAHTKGAPVIYVDHPGYQNLIGRVEHVAQFGALMTDFTLIKPGALHQANGGYLMVDVRKLLTQPYAWEALKRLLYAHEIRIESLEKMLSLVSTVSLEPQAIPLKVKVVLLGERELYYLLHAYDPDFAEIFKVVADFEQRIDRTDENVRLYARLIGTLAQRGALRPFDRTAVARIIEHGARLVGDAEKLSTHMRSITDLLHEADYWAASHGRSSVTRDDVEEAIEHQIHRVSRLKESIQEEIQRNTIFIDTDGERVGQANALSVLSLGDFAFGQPSRVSATVYIGKGQVIDIEREVELGGALHSKGVLILSSFIASRYAGRQPLSLSASLVFEQSYAMVDGDSASLTELCVLLSALSELPIKQSFAMTGSVNQHGDVQPIGGVNEKIEGFFDVCRTKGLTGRQGVLIPAANVKHLMLRRDVVEAVAAGQFRIHPVTGVDQAIALLTGVDAGEPDPEGNYPHDSVNGRAMKRLAEMSRIRHEFGRKDGGTEDPNG